MLAGLKDKKSERQLLLKSNNAFAYSRAQTELLIFLEFYEDAFHLMVHPIAFVLFNSISLPESKDFIASSM